MAERVDLDAVERYAREGDADTHPADPRRTVHGDDLLALVAELRAAREALRLAPRPPMFNTNTAEYVVALTAYDRAAGQPATADQPPGVG